MKRKIFVFILCLVTLLTVSGCSTLSLTLKSVGKDSTGAKKMATAINKDIKNRKRMGDYTLYGIDMSMDTEGNGKAHLIYTRKLLQELKYSDIMIVTVDTRTGKVESAKEADFATYGTLPYEVIVDGAPLMIESWKQDSTSAMAIAQKSFFEEDDFVHNYVQICTRVKDGIGQYDITFVSLVKGLRYECAVDGMSGAILKKEIKDL